MIPLCRRVIKRYDTEGNLIEVIDPAQQAEQAAEQAIYQDTGLFWCVILLILVIVAFYFIRRMVTDTDLY